jgi:hypothetical protein
MNTVFLLMARYEGLPIIPVDVVCRDYFSHLTVEKFLRKVLAGEISLPIVRREGVRLEDLAAYIDERVAEARSEMEDAQDNKRKADAGVAVAIADLPKGTIYFVQGGSYVKIGVTKGPLLRRLKNLATASPHKLSVLATIENAPITYEATLHDRFAADRVNGEWFEYSDQIAKFIEDLQGAAA